MTKKTKKNIKNYFNSYSFNRSIIPFPEKDLEKIKPPISDEVSEESIAEKEAKLLIVKKELSLEEQAQQYMDAYRKAERILVINFYTGGGAYKRGILDAIYRGFNPLNPTT